MRTELLIVGAGAAGMAAALSAWEAGCRDILLLDRREAPGGILPQCLHEGFGLSLYGRELTGPDYAARLAARLKKTGVRLCLGTELLSLRADRTAILSDRRGLTQLRFVRLILAAGCREKSIGSLSLSGTRPAGIFTAGQAQEMMNLRGQTLGKEILILGSGDLGLIMARQFTLAGGHVIAVVEQAEHYGGMARNFHRCIEAYGIPMRYHTTVSEIHGSGRISGVTLRDLKNGEASYLPCDTLVTALGLIPEREAARGLGEPEWLYLAGNCRRVHDLVDSAVKEAERIGREAAAALRA